MRTNNFGITCMVKSAGAVHCSVVWCCVTYRVAPLRIEGRLHHNRTADLAIPNSVRMEFERLRERIEEMIKNGIKIIKKDRIQKQNR
jgi:hypothetical protein